MSKMKLSMNEVISLYESGSSTSEISLLAGVSDRHIRQLLTNNGVEKRARGSWKRKYSFNEDYFKHWTNDMAYLLGFFITDGYIASQSQSIAFTQKDPTILEEIKNVFDSNQPLYINKHTGVYSLLFHSKIMKTDL
ncbi:LAGLIDADG family homing endonuclease [Pseudalkalibacillus sp. NRS-1564]|uniref:LAGLIDADG family homing endonuclease n=1 Tax=Pseudalkalibacillus sp. NRS-1564 TaxID=3233900 RepID=UPI003D2C182C